MQKRKKIYKKQRLQIFFMGSIVAILTTILTLYALGDGVYFFHSPKEIAEGKVTSNTLFRIGGLVKEGSVTTREDSPTIYFTITDGIHDIPVIFHKSLPSLFREGQGVVALGMLSDQKHFMADEVLAKHDENYMPTEVVDSLKQAGTWKGDTP